jgi:UDP-N-acetylmuramyl pentapeptide phosphotransferase/UDP-N-acetylglucosamine-1-phosphate transferase
MSGIALIWAAIAVPLAWILLAIVERIAPTGFLNAHMREQPTGTTPVRQLGGFAVVPLYLAGLALTARHQPGEWRFLTALGGAIALLWLVGMADDHRHLSAHLRLMAHFLAAIAVVLTLPTSLALFDGLVPVWVERMAIVFGLVYGINATNFMDGMDLMSVAGLGIPICAGALLLAGSGASIPIAFASLVMAAALVGFTPFNLPPARLYLGDNGALPLGLAAGIACVLLAFETNLIAAVLPFGYYLADSASTLALRALRGENIFRSHSGHAYQVARKAGRSVWWVVAVVVVANTLLALTAAYAAGTGDVGALIGAAVVGVAISAGVVVFFRRQGRTG